MAGTSGSITLQAPAIDVTQESIVAVYASGKQSLNTTVQARNATIARNAAGRYTVTFPAHPDGAAYEVLFGVDEDANRDVPKVSVVDGTQTSTGFDVVVTVDDNGGAADTYNDEPWSFAVLYNKDVVVDVGVG